MSIVFKTASEQQTGVGVSVGVGVYVDVGVAVGVLVGVGVGVAVAVGVGVAVGVAVGATQLAPVAGIIPSPTLFAVTQTGGLLL